MRLRDLFSFSACSDKWKPKQIARRSQASATCILVSGEIWMFNELTAKRTVFHYILRERLRCFNKITLFLHDTTTTVVRPLMSLSITQQKSKGQQRASKVACPCLLQVRFVFKVFFHFVRRSELTPFTIMISLL